LIETNGRASKQCEENTQCSRVEVALQSSSLAGISAKLLSDLICSGLGHRGTLAGYRVVQEREDYAVIEATLDGPHMKVVVKLAGPRAQIDCPFERTAGILRLVRNATSVPIAEVLAADVSYSTWPWRYLLTSHIPGLTWAVARPKLQRQEAVELFRDFGRVAGLLHTISFPFCGELDPAGVVEGEADFYTALLRRAHRRIPNPEHAALFIALLAERAGLFDDLIGGVLCHEDLNPHNILIEQHHGGWRVAAILDFESTWAGQAESDLARLELWRGMMGPGFLTAYEKIVPISPGYAERRPLYQVLWCLEYAQPTPEHNADTARVCALLGISPVSFSQKR
jgi:aminoglycoside phosphotransferase (APT) family kinase protein